MWATRIGFILAAIGSAVGLGNIWRFPFQASANGGAAFLTVYLAAVLVIGIPAILAEFVIGRRAKTSAIGAFSKLGRPRWWFVGAIGVVAAGWTLSYYSVIGGWVIRYIVGATTGAALADPGTYFGTVSVGIESVVVHALFMLLTVGIVAFGIEDGIELATKFMVPSIVVLLLGLAVYAFTLEGAGAGYDFLFTADFGAIVDNAGTVIPAAVGQALFSLSLGYSVMITYASYLGKDDSLLSDGLTVAVANTGVGILAGLVVLPLLAIQSGGEISAEGGPGAVFVAIPTALAELPGGSVVGQAVGFVFFAVVLVAALSSAISLLETVVAYLVDNYGFARLPTAVGLGAGIFLLGVPSAWDTAWLTWFDNISVALFLPLAVLFVVLFVGWVLGADAVAELREGSNSPGIATVWLWALRTVVLVAVIGVVALNLYDLFLVPDEGTYFVPPL